MVESEPNPITKSNIIENVLNTCYEIRKNLASKFKLPTNYEIEELTDDSPYLGICSAEWSPSIKIQKIQIRIFSKETGSLFRMASIISTFIHELVHTITFHDSSTIEFHNKKSWIHPDHNDEFYKNYRSILEESEKQKILMLPKIKDKFSKRALQRFDSIDLNYTELPDSCSIYRHVGQKENNKTNLIVKVFYQNLSKIIFVENRNLEELEKKIENKFKIKIKTIKNEKQNILDEEGLIMAEKKIILFINK